MTDDRTDAELLADLENTDLENVEIDYTDEEVDAELAGDTRIPDYT